MTDANLVLGRIDPETFAGGQHGARHRGRPRGGRRRSATSSGSASIALAEGIVSVINAKMAQAIRTLTVEQGIEPRDFALVAFGGAGPMHAAFLAQELGIGEVIVPRLAGAFSAWGMLETELRRDFTPAVLPARRRRPTSRSSPRSVRRPPPRAARRSRRRACPRPPAASSIRSTCATRRRSTRSRSRSTARLRRASPGSSRRWSGASTRRTTCATGIRTRARRSSSWLVARPPRFGDLGTRRARGARSRRTARRAQRSRDVVFDGLRARDARSSRARSSEPAHRLEGPRRRRGGHGDHRGAAGLRR